MIEVKKVIILNGEIINIGEWESPEPIPEGAIIEEREMQYTEEYGGWREINWSPPLTQEEKIAQLEQDKEELAQTLDMVLTDLIPNLLGGN